MSSFCVDRIINDRGELVCVVTNEKWQDLLSLVSLIEKIYYELFDVSKL
jgi:hypothetical protein